MSASENAGLKRVVLASLAGATIEWYDFFLYGVVAGIVFNKLYFPASNPVVSTLLAYATFAVGFITRPLGGIIFGHFGDKLGRKTMLILTLLIMGGATILIGLVPTYAQIGLWAPALLLFLRVFQGIGLGGEWGGAVLMTYEYAPSARRGFYGSLPQIGLAIGLCLASGVVAILSYALTEQQFMSWGWRIGFLLSVILVGIGIWIRFNIAETPEFKAVKAAHLAVKLPIARVMKGHLSNVIAGMGVRYIDGVFFNIFAVWIISYLTQYISVTRTDALIAVTGAALVLSLFIPVFGILSDKIGRVRLYFWGSLATGLSSLPAFWLISHSGGHLPLIWLAVIVPLGIFYASIYAPEAALFCELFPAPVRYTGISFVYQFSGIFASGLTPIVAVALWKFGHANPTYISGYVLFSALISALACHWIGTRQNAATETGTILSISSSR